MSPRRVHPAVQADADDGTLREFAERVEQRCPVSDDVANATVIDLSVESQ